MLRWLALGLSMCLQLAFERKPREGTERSLYQSTVSIEYLVTSGAEGGGDWGGPGTPQQAASLQQLTKMLICVYDYKIGKR
jgi:hypothetical protein